jgi:uncharacterized membrane protein YeiH
MFASVPRPGQLKTDPPKKSVAASKNNDKEALDFLAERGRVLGIPLSLSERQMIAKEIAANNQNGGRLRKKDWEKLVSRRSLADEERLTLSDYLAKSHDVHLGQHMLKWTSRLGVAFFALAGAHTAGEAGMHIVGATLVGCATALGGGTINNIVTGVTPVGWVRDPTFLILTVGASAVGFYLWPLMEQLLLDYRDDDDEDNNNNNNNNWEKENSNPSALRYSLESIALGALAVVGAQQGIVLGCHPIVSSVLGVTIAFGGVLRDLMCQRDLTLGAATGCQSYGIASFSGAAVYVALRELHMWNCAGSTVKLVHGGIPIGLRILMGFGTALAVRLVAWQNKPDNLFLSMEASAAVNIKSLKGLLSSSKSPSEPKAE